jgi:hypothetical protein
MYYLARQVEDNWVDNFERVILNHLMWWQNLNATNSMLICTLRFDFTNELKLIEQTKTGSVGT